MKGIIFDIQEFSVHDGPGIRVAVFLKGCFLRCAWCHNPEGLEFGAGLMRGSAGDRIVGTSYEAGELAQRLNSQAQLLRMAEGGVTFSGGEPLAQAGFLEEVIDKLDGIHIVLDTSGNASPSDFARVASKVQLVHFDLKLMDPEQHRRWTGVDNSLILQNFEMLCQLGIPYVIRIPLVPGVSDTPENLEAIAQKLAGRPGLERVDLLPYNPAAGAKYEACGMVYAPGFDPAHPINANAAFFEERGLKVRIA